MSIECILFDLDDTLLVEVDSAHAAVRQTCRLAQDRYGLDPAVITPTVFETAKPLWHNAPARDYCLRIGVSSWEGLWARFDGDDPNLSTLREWAPTYRFETWRRALAAHGWDDEDLAMELAREFPRQRRLLNVKFEDVEPVLDRLIGQLPMGLLTNGLPCLQRDKIAGSNLAPYFDAIVIAGDLGVRKPDPLVFQHALRRLRVEPQNAIMVGNGLKTDIAGAQRCGIPSVLVNRPDPHGPDDSIIPDYRIDRLTELFSILDGSFRPDRAPVSDGH